MHLIVITGNNGVGKTTVGNYIHNDVLPGSIKFNINDALKKHVYNSLTDITYEQYLSYFDENDTPNITVNVKHINGDTHRLTSLYGICKTAFYNKTQKKEMAEWYITQLRSIHKLRKHSVLIIDDLFDNALYENIRIGLKIPDTNSHVFKITRNKYTEYDVRFKPIMNYGNLINNGSGISFLKNNVFVKLRYISITANNWPIKIK